MIHLYVPYTKEKTADLTDGLGNWLSTYIRMNLDPYHSTYRKIKTKCIKDLDIKTKTRNFLEDKFGNTLEDVDIAKNFLNSNTVV